MSEPTEEGSIPPVQEQGVSENLPPPPPLPAQGFVPQQVQIPQQVQVQTVTPPRQQKPLEPPKTRLTAMQRPGRGRSGRPVKLLSNHFGVSFTNLQDSFHYNVTITSERGAITNKTLLRKIMDKLKEVYGKTELDGKEFAYDGEKSMFTVGGLSRNNIECTVVLEESGASGGGGASDNGRKKIRRDDRAEKFKVEISFAAKISMKSLEAVLRGEVSDKCQDALRVLDIILRQHAARKGYLLVRQSFFHWSFAPLVDLGGGVQGCKGYHISFRPTQKGLSLNMDVSTTMLIQKSLILDFLRHSQQASHPSQLDWLKARRMLKGVRVRALHTNMEHKILGFSEKTCKDQLFSLKVKNQGNQDGGSPQTVEVTVLEYFNNTKNITLKLSADFPCLDVGRAKRPNYLPIELCEILPGQRYTKSLNSSQRTSLVEKSRQKPEERMDVLQKAMSANDYNSDPLLRACNIRVETQLMGIEGRILEPPKLKFGQFEEAPQRGRWNFNNKTVHRAGEVKSWAVVSFARVNENEVRRIANDLAQCCNKKGLNFPQVTLCITEPPHFQRGGNPVERVDKMLGQMKSKLSQPPDFLLCLLPERKTSDLYGPWKKKFLSEVGIVNQCIVPTKKMNDQYYTNVALKINAKIGGLNSVLLVETNRRIPILSQYPTIIIGMDVSHGSPGHGDSPSIAAVVSSRDWPLISRYRASVRTQSRKVEMIEALYKPLPNGRDDGMIRELLLDFYATCKDEGDRKPRHMIIFRDGVSESQFDQVLNVEIEAILKACDSVEKGYKPKITLIIAQKNHHTKLFQGNQNGNVQPGTIVDTQICHPRNYDFFLCPQNGPIGTSRPTHYHVLLDENGFSVDDLQLLVHALSYVYQRSTTAISAVAPINYAHLAATQMQQFLKAEELSESASRSGRGEGSTASGGGGSVPDLPKLHAKVRDTMFFC